MFTWQQNSRALYLLRRIRIHWGTSPSQRREDTYPDRESETANYFHDLPGAHGFADWHRVGHSFYANRPALQGRSLLSALCVSQVAMRSFPLPLMFLILIWHRCLSFSFLLLRQIRLLISDSNRDPHPLQGRTADWFTGADGFNCVLT